MGDAEGYRPAGEVERLKSIDPIVRYRQRLIDAGTLASELAAGEERCRAQVQAAMTFARNSAAPTEEEALQHVFA
jgi:pyruvate dehydrogenase E1 component alpha subunit